MSSTTISPHSLDPWLEVVRKKVAAISFGSIQITVHDGRVTQVESLEKTRFATSDGDPANSSRKLRRNY